MQTTEFGLALQRITEILGIVEWYKQLGLTFSEGNAAVTDQAKVEFARCAFQFARGLSALTGTPEVLANAFELKKIADPGNLSKLIADFRQATQTQQVRGHREFWELYYTLNAVLATNEVVQRSLIVPKFEHYLPNSRFLVLDISDYDNSGVELVRLQLILLSLVELYGIVAQYLNVDAASPRVAFADSGSDVKIGLEGVKDALDAISNMFARAWNSIRFSKNDKIERDLATATRGIEFLALVNREAAAGDLDTETAQKLEVAARKNMLQLLGAGVMAEEVQEVETFDPSRGPWRSEGQEASWARSNRVER